MSTFSLDDVMEEIDNKEVQTVNDEPQETVESPKPVEKEELSTETEPENIEQPEEETVEEQKTEYDFDNGLNEMDIKNWAEQYNCSEQEVVDAIEMGWHGPKGFSKDKKFLDPISFIEKSKVNGSLMYKKWQKQQENSKVQKQMYESMMNMQRMLMEEKLAKEQAKITELENKIKSAKEDFDVDAVEQLALEKAKAELQAKKEQPAQQVNNRIDNAFETDWFYTSPTAQRIRQSPALQQEFNILIHALDTMPAFANYTSKERIAFLERKLGGDKFTKPEATAVGRSTNGLAEQAITWSSIPMEYKAMTLEIAKNLHIIDDEGKVNPAEKDEWNRMQKQLIENYKKIKKGV